MRRLALVSIAVGCANDPALGNATWTETPAGEPTLFKRAFITRSGEIAVRFYDADRVVHCSEIEVATVPPPSESRISFSVPAIQAPGQVGVRSPLDPATATATIFMSSRIYTSGTIVLTDAGDRLAGTFRAAGKTSSGELGTIDGMFDAPYCD